MVDTVVSLTGTPTTFGEPSEAIIKAIERILERAKRGEIGGIAWAEITSGSHIGCGFEVDSARWSEMLGAITALQLRYAHREIKDWLE